MIVLDVVKHVLAVLAALPLPVVFLVVLLMMIVETSLLVGLLIPGEIVVLMAAAALDPRWAPLVTGAALIGTLIGQSGGYWLGRWSGPGLRSSWVGRVIGAQRWSFAESIVRGPGARSMIGTRFASVVHAVVPVVVGGLGLSYRRFLRIATAGAVLWAVVHTVLGVLLGQAARAISETWAVAAFSLSGLTIATIIVLRAARRPDGQVTDGQVTGEPGKDGVES